MDQQMLGCVYTVPLDSRVPLEQNQKRKHWGRECFHTVPVQHSLMRRTQPVQKRTEPVKVFTRCRYNVTPLRLQGCTCNAPGAGTKLARTGDRKTVRRAAWTKRPIRANFVTDPKWIRTMQTGRYNKWIVIGYWNLFNCYCFFDSSLNQSHHELTDQSGR